MTTNAVIIPTYSEHFQCALRLLRSIRDSVTDQDKFQLYVVVGDDRELDVFQRHVNQYVPGSTVNTVSFTQVLKTLRFPVLPDVLVNVYNRKNWKFCYQSLKKLCSTVYAAADRTLVLDAESYVFRPAALVEEIIEPYIARPRHFSYVSGEPFLQQLLDGCAHLLGYNREVLTAYNFEYQDWILEKDLLTQFLGHVTGAWSTTNFFDAIYNGFFGPRATGEVFFEIMAYRYFLERQHLASNPRVENYEFLDSFDALSNCMADPALAACRPKDHPLEHLGNWLTPLTFDGIQQFVRQYNIRMLRIERHYPQPWLIRQLLRETPEIKMFVCNQDYELYL